MYEAIEAFKAEIFKKGIVTPPNIKLGEIIRFSDDGSKNSNGWGILNVNTDGSAGGSFGSWRGDKHNFFYRPDGQPMTTAERQGFTQQIQEAQEKAAREKELKQARAAKQAQEKFDGAGIADPNHGYLVKKQVQPYGIRQLGDTLLIPIMDTLNRIQSLQEIQPGGQKQFSQDGKIKGGLYLIGIIGSTPIIYIGEGYSTMASVHAATGNPCVISFNSGNLKRVAEIIKEQYPEKTIIICADNDIATEKKIGLNPGRKAGEEAAAAIDAELCICPMDSDFNDLQQAQGISAVQQALKKTRKIKDETWENPVPLKEDHAPELDPNLLPGIIGDMARAVSTETETPIELAAGLILSVLGTACQGKFMVKIKPGYQEPVNTWTVTALDPANRKSSVLMKITNPLSQWETMKHVEVDTWIKEAASKLQNQEARIKSLRVQYGKAKQEDLQAIEAEILDIENNLVQVPSYPKIWAQDVTPEHLGTLLNRHDEVMSILSSEGGIFDIIGGRYSNGVANLDLFLQAHSGDPVRVDRGSRDPVFLNSPALTLGLSPQPEVLRGLADKPGFRGKGLLARFLYFLPKSKLGYRGLDSEPIPENIKTAYQNLIFRLLDIIPGEDENGERQPYILHFSKQAFLEWSDFYMVVEKELREGGRFEYITDWAGKLPGAAARISALLHCAKNPDQPWAVAIDLETMQNALGIAAIFADHALIAFDLMGADRSLEEARKVWRWVKHGRQKTFTKRDCFNALRGTFHRVANLEEPIKVLVERNYIKELQKEKKVGKPSTKYFVNPEITAGWS